MAPGVSRQPGGAGGRSDVELEQLARRQLQDYRAINPGTAFAEGLTLTLPEAYRVQDAVARLREDGGERIAGYKVGCTSESVQARFGMRGPVSGFLFDSELRSSGATLAVHDFANLAVEAETAVRMGDDGEVAEVLVVIELHNYVFRGIPPTLAELVANNAVHAGAVLGAASVPPGALPASARLSLSIDGRVVDHGPPFPMRGGADASVAWLLDNLAPTGRHLRAGDLVLVGTSLGIHEVGPGHEVVAHLDGLPPTTARTVDRSVVEGLALV